MKTVFFKLCFYSSAVISLLALIALLISTRTSIHYSGGEDIASLTCASLRYTHPVPGRTFITVSPGFSRADADAISWVPNATMNAALWQFDLPLWIPFAACAVAAFVSHRRAFHNPEVCSRCRYSLVGLEDAAKCPECGYSIDSRPESGVLKPIPAS